MPLVAQNGRAGFEKRRQGFQNAAQDMAGHDDDEQCEILGKRLEIGRGRQSLGKGDSREKARVFV